MIEKPTKRWESEQYRRAVASLQCLVCGTEPCQASHLKGIRSHNLGGGRALKTHDFLCSPLCPSCHADYDQRTGHFLEHTLESAPIWNKVAYSEESLYMGAITLAKLLDSGQWELRRKRN